MEPGTQAVRQSESHSGSQSLRQSGFQAVIQAGSQTVTQAVRLSDRQSVIQAFKQAVREAGSQAVTQSDRQSVSIPHEALWLVYNAWQLRLKLPLHTLQTGKDVAKVKSNLLYASSQLPIGIANTCIPSPVAQTPFEHLSAMLAKHTTHITIYIIRIQYTIYNTHPRQDNIHLLQTPTSKHCNTTIPFFNLSEEIT